MQITCTLCGAEGTVADAKAGTRVTCRACGAAVDVPLALHDASREDEIEVQAPIAGTPSVLGIQERMDAADAQRQTAEAQLARAHAVEMRQRTHRVRWGVLVVVVLMCAGAWGLSSLAPPDPTQPRPAQVPTAEHPPGTATADPALLEAWAEEIQERMDAASGERSAAEAEDARAREEWTEPPVRPDRPRLTAAVETSRGALRITNRDSYAWKGTTVELNSGLTRSGWIVNLGTLESGESITLSLNDFVKGGMRFDPYMQDIETVRVRAYPPDAGDADDFASWHSLGKS